MLVHDMMDTAPKYQRSLSIKLDMSDMMAGHDGVWWQLQCFVPIVMT